jgi:hypothetical protein
MSQNEAKILDKQGKFLQVLKDGRTRNDVGWIPGRILLSDKRLVLAANEGKRTIPISAITKLGGRHDVNQAVARVAEYASIEYDGNNVILVTASAQPEEIEEALYQAILDNNTVLARHPAVEGGVVQDTDWHKAQVKYDSGTETETHSESNSGFGSGFEGGADSEDEDDEEEESESIIFGLADGTFAEIELDDIGGFNTAEQLVRDENRAVLKVEHAQEDGTSIQTHVTGTGQHVQVMTSLFREGHQRSEIGVELEQQEQRVLMALYTGVSPFKIPEFVDMDVDKVEEIYERLIELDALDEVRMRREVELTARGRQIASGAMDNE